MLINHPHTPPSETLDDRKIGTHIRALAASAIWGILLLSGFGLIEGVRAQQVPGYPVSGQLHFYIHFPAVVFALIVVTWIVGACYRPAKRPADMLIIVALLCAPIYVAISGGGV